MRFTEFKLVLKENKQSVVIIGDSIAVGIGGSEPYAKGGISTVEVLKRVNAFIKSGKAKGATVILSSGASNSSPIELEGGIKKTGNGGLEPVEDQLKALKAAGATVALVGTGSTKSIAFPGTSWTGGKKYRVDLTGVNERLESMAQSFGATFLGPLEDYDSGMHSGKGDGIHPYGGYKKLLAAGSNVAKADIITPDVVKPNQSPKVSTGDYTVVSGDNLTKIAKAHGVALADLIAANKQIKNPDRIYPGDVISIPSSGSTAIAPKQDVKPDVKPDTAPSPAPIKKRSSGKYEIRNVDSASDVFEFFKGKGLNDNQCAAFVGNIYTESRVNTAAHNKNENARGIVQWRMDRLQNLANFAKKLKKKWHDLELQLDFTWHELTGKYKHVLPELEANKNNLAKCVEIIMNKYEVASPKSYPERLGFAESAMRLFGSGTDKKSA